MDLQGDLSSIRLADIFQMLSLGGHEGVLSIFLDGTEKKIIFSRNGISIASTGATAHYRLGEKLLAVGKITHDQLGEALRRQKHTKRVLGEILQDMNLISQDELVRCIRDQIEEEIYSLFELSDARFSFRKGDTSEEFVAEQPKATRLVFDPREIIMSAARRLDELHRMQDRFRSFDEILVAEGTAADVEETDLKGKILRLLDGRRDIEGIALLLDEEKVEVAKLLYLLMGEGSARHSTAEELAAHAEESRTRGDFEETVRLYRAACRRPNGDKYHVVLADVYEQEAKVLEATEERKRAAQIFRELGNFDAELQELLKAKKLSPADGEVREALFRFYLESDREEEAISEAKELVHLYSGKNEFGKAHEYCEKLTQLVPLEASYRAKLVELALASGNTGNLAKRCDELERAVPAGQEGRLISFYERMLRAHPAADAINQKLRRLREAKWAKAQKRSAGLRQVGAVILVAFVMIVMTAAGGYQLWAWIMLQSVQANVRELVDQRKYSQAREILDGFQKRFRYAAASRKVAPALASLASFERSQAARMAYSDICLKADALEKEGRYEDAINLFKGYLSEYQEAATVEEARAEIARLEKNLANWLAVQLAKLRAQAQDAESRGDAGAAIAIYQEILSDDHYSVMADAARAKIAELEQVNEAAGQEVARMRALEEAREYEKAHKMAWDLWQRYEKARISAQIGIPLLITSIPEAVDVFVNDKPAGRTPFLMHYSPPFSERIRLERAGFATRDVVLGTEPGWHLDIWLPKKPLWTFETRGPLQSTPLRFTDQVYVTSRDGSVYALSSTDGRLLWQYQAGGPAEIVSSPLLAKGLVLVGTYAAEVLAVDASTGSLVWKRPTEEYIRGSLCLAGELAITGTANGVVYALRAVDGTIEWRRRVTAPVLGSPAVSGNVVYVGATDGTLHAMEASSGRTVWTFKAEQTWESSPATSNGLVFIGADDGTFYCIDAVSGSRKWVSKAEGKISGRPSVAGGTVYFTSEDGTVHALNADDGRLLWKFKTSGRVRSSPAATNNVVYVGSDDGNLYALASHSGALLWKGSTGGAISSAPHVSFDTVYVGCEDKRAYAFGG